MTSLIIILGLIVAAQSILLALLWANIKDLQNEDQRLNFRINNTHELIRVITLNKIYGNSQGGLLTRQ